MLGVYGKVIAFRFLGKAGLGTGRGSRAEQRTHAMRDNPPCHRGKKIDISLRWPLVSPYVQEIERFSCSIVVLRGTMIMYMDSGGKSLIDGENTGCMMMHDDDGRLRPGRATIVIGFGYSST